METITSLADPEIGALNEIVDLDRYPLDRPGSDAWKDMVKAVQATLSGEGLITLADFLTPAALAKAASEIATTVPHIRIRSQSATVYHRDVTDSDAVGAAAQACQTELTWFAGHVTRDMIPPYAVSHRLYVSPLFKRFIGACVGQELIFEYADPLAGLVATVLPPGGQYPWHYDTNEFVVTIMTQKPESGGHFEFFKDLRTPGDENLNGLADALTGASEQNKKTVETSPGDLQLFLGRYSLHQVTQTGGADDRHVLVLSYADRPGVIGPVDRTRSVYGRVTEAHLLAEQVRTATSDGLIL